MTELSKEIIQTKIYTFRGIQVILDRDLAQFYGVETKVLNQAVKRNIDRFPETFLFQLNKDEFFNWKSHFVTSNSIKMGMRRLPFVFTEQGIAMLSAVLRSNTAIQVSINIMNSFISFRQQLNWQEQLLMKISNLENNQSKTNERVDQLFLAMEKHSFPPSKGIFFEGQLFDAYVFVCELIRNASSSIILIDNYIDETVLLLLSKRNPNCEAIIYTNKINQQLQLDLKKYNEQYPEIKVKLLTASHDRFMIMDREKLYHIGASLKDLGKKWFAFSKIDELLPDVLQKLPI